MNDCCKVESGKMGENGWKQGILYGILPHTFCIAFVVLSVLGATVASTIFRKFLLIPYFFEFLIGLSFIFAAISAVFYLKRKERLSVRGVRENSGYLGILFGTTIAVNLLLFFVIFPATANIGSRGEIRPASPAKRGEDFRALRDVGGLNKITLEVRIPCAGHAGLITGEIRNLGGVKDVKFSLPNTFEVSFDPKQTNVNEILRLEIFKTFPATIK